MSRKSLKRQQKLEYHKEFKTADKSSSKKRQKSPGRKVK